MLFNKNHFIKISMIIVLLLANYNLCSNKLKKTSTNKVLNLLKTNIKTGDYNGGDWETGYKCPKFLIGKGDDSQVDQGGFLLKAKELKLNTGENLKGFILEFENAPKANSIITKIATKIDAVKYYLPWRFINSNQMNYEHEYWENKKIKGALFLGSSEIYFYTIFLPYKHFGDYISMEQSQNIMDAMKINANLNQSLIKTAKSNLEKKANIFENANGNIKKLEEKAKTLPNLSQKWQDTHLTFLTTVQAKENANNKMLEAKRDQTQQKMSTISMQLSAAKTKLDQLQSELESSTRDIVMQDAWVEKIKKGTEISKVVAEANDRAAKADKEADTAYARLKEAATERIADVSASQEGFRAQDKVKFQSNLDKIYPK